MGGKGRMNEERCTEDRLKGRWGRGTRERERERERERCEKTGGIRHAVGEGRRGASNSASTRLWWFRKTNCQWD